MVDTEGMRPAVILAVAATVALIAALLTGSTWLGVTVILLAAAGIVLLVRDWRAVGSRTGELTPETSDAALLAGDFSPDISADTDGPTSDARSDQF